jgi:hypothetical protein
MRAASGRNRDSRGAVIADLGRHVLLPDSVRLPDYHEDGEGHYHEVEYGVDEHAVIDRRSASLLTGLPAKFTYQGLVSLFAAFFSVAIGLLGLSP